MNDLFKKIGLYAGWVAFAAAALACILHTPHP
jgi:hypothetical protein